MRNRDLAGDNIGRDRKGQPTRAGCWPDSSGQTGRGSDGAKDPTRPSPRPF